MKINGKFMVAASTFVFLALGLGILSAPAHGASTLVARSQLRRTVDPSERSAYGTVTMVESASKQKFTVRINALSLESFSIWQNDGPTFTTNAFNSLDHPVAPLDRIDIKKGIWVRGLQGLGIAPPEFLQLGFLDLQEISGGRADICNTADNNLIVGVTNIVGNVTNVVFGIPIPQAGATNNIVCSLWAPLPFFVANPRALNFKGGSLLTRPPEAAPPSPNATGTIKVRFSGPTGRSKLNMVANNLTRGQVYTVFIADTNDPDEFTLIPAGDMTPDRANSSTFRFIRDTQFGDPLPQQVRDVGDLSGRRVQIRDANGFFIHLEGVMP